MTTTTIAVVEPLALGERTGLHLAAVAPGSLVDIDLDTGVVVEHELGVVVDWNASGVALVRSGALVWRPFPLASAPAVTLAPIPSGFGEAWLLEDGSGVWVGGDGQRVADAPSELSLLATDGSGPITTATIPADAYPFGVSGDRLVLGAAGRLYTIDRGGDVADVGSGFSLAMGSGYVVVRRCDESLRCGSDRVDLATGEAETLPGLSEFAGQRLGGGWVGPSGAVLFTAFGSDGGVFLADAAGTRRLVDPRQRITDVPTSGSISPDGRWVSVAGVGIAWVGPAAGGDGVHLEVPGGFVDGPALLLDGPAV